MTCPGAHEERDSVVLHAHTPTDPGTGPDGSHEVCPYCDGTGECWYDLDPHGEEPLTLSEAARHPYRKRLGSCPCGGVSEEELAADRQDAGEREAEIRIAGGWR